MASDGRGEHTDDLVDVTDARAITACFSSRSIEVPSIQNDQTPSVCLP
jgi:hypothetical protein